MKLLNLVYDLTPIDFVTLVITVPHTFAHLRTFSHIFAHSTSSRLRSPRRQGAASARRSLAGSVSLARREFFARSPQGRGCGRAGACVTWGATWPTPSSSPSPHPRSMCGPEKPWARLRFAWSAGRRKNIRIGGFYPVPVAMAIQIGVARREGAARSRFGFSPRSPLAADWRYRTREAVEKLSKRLREFFYSFSSSVSRSRFEVSLRWPWSRGRCCGRACGSFAAQAVASMIPSLALAKGPLLWARRSAGARGGACVPRSRLHVRAARTRFGASRARAGVCVLHARFGVPACLVCLSHYADYNVPHTHRLRVPHTRVCVPQNAAGVMKDTELAKL